MQANHTIAKQLIEQHPAALIGLEHLTDIRERTKRKKRRRKHNGKGTERVSPKARHPPIACTPNGPLPNCMPSSVTKPCAQVHSLSRWMQITPQKPVPFVDILLMRTAPAVACSLRVKIHSVATRCTLI